MRWIPQKLRKELDGLFHEYLKRLPGDIDDSKSRWQIYMEVIHECESEECKARR